MKKNFRYYGNREAIGAVLLLTALIAGCTSRRTMSVTPTPTLAEFRRDFSILEGSGELMGTQLAEQFQIVNISDIPESAQTNPVINPANSYSAFTWCEQTCRIVIEKVETKQLYELEGPFLGWRPFSDLQWLSNEIIAFDQWSNPDHGIHYEINFDEQSITYISIITTVENE